MFGKLKELRSRHGLRRGLPRFFRLEYQRIFHRQSEEKLVRDLLGLGVTPGSTIFLHSAMSKIGYVPGACATVLRALQRAIGSEGNLVMPAYSYGGLAFEYVRRNPVFDARSTPSDVGELPEFFRKSPGVLRSLHPTHSVCAWGRDARLITEGHEQVVFPFGPGSPFFRFMELGGFVLMLGAPFNNMAMLRVVEDQQFPFEVYIPRTFRLRVIDFEGKELWVETKVHNPDMAPFRKAVLLIPHLEERGRITRGHVGQADSVLVNCRNLYAVLKELCDQGITQYLRNP